MFTQFTQELERLREVLESSTTDLAARLDQIDEKVEQKLLLIVFNLMMSQYVYFNRGFEIFKAMKPRIDEMKKHVDQIVEQTNDESVHPAKEGYLYMQCQPHHRMKKTWLRQWFILRDGWLYSKKEGKVCCFTLTQQLVPGC